MSVPIYVVDAFADRFFRGNPAAVCLLDRERDAAWMQSVAGEMNLSETAFVLRQGEEWGLRWFTPKAEVDLCGHATLASAHVLWETGRAGRDRAVSFLTRSGKLSCVEKQSWIEMDFPSEPAVDVEEVGGLLGALGVDGVVVGRKRNRMDYLVEVLNEGVLRELKPDMRLLAKLPVRGVIVTAASGDKQFDFVSRFFAPGVGIDEDPVTGSAHCCLGPYWGEKLGKREMVALQMSQRGGVVRVELRGDRVVLGGQAVTVVAGEWLGV
jgi:predicted PhzF superfamily epimerase YddE/YHI9